MHDEGPEDWHGRAHSRKQEGQDRRLEEARCTRRRRERSHHSATVGREGVPPPSIAVAGTAERSMGSPEPPDPRCLAMACIKRSSWHANPRYARTARIHAGKSTAMDCGLHDGKTEMLTATCSTTLAGQHVHNAACQAASMGSGATVSQVSHTTSSARRTAVTAQFVTFLCQSSVRR